jgi:hypothetical protein
MTDEYQIEIPQSFLTLFVEPGRQKLNASREHIAQRYELCEDMANLLTETAGNMQFSLGIAENDVLKRIHCGLTGEAAVVTEVEARWVLCRVAELMGWALPMKG